MDSSVPASFAALRAFREAAKRGGFQAAAQALGLTPSAVSHQIRRLEVDLGAPLFDRGTRSVRLTAKGEALAQELEAAFLRIEAALVRARTGAKSTLRVSALASVAQHWLIPRLGAFKARHPAIALEIDTANALANFETDGVDVAIRNLAAPAPGLWARKLIDVEPVVLCAASLAIRAPADLARATLIHISARPNSWARWLEAAGFAGLKPKGDLTVDTIPAAIEAAAAGAGVTLAWAPLAWEAPAAQRLVCPFPSPPDLGASYYVACPRASRADPAIAAFTDWVLAEMGKDRRRLVAQHRARTAQA